MEVFSQLNADEQAVLLNAPVWTAILIGAADGKMDAEERSWSAKLMHTRSYAGLDELKDYYKEVFERFDAKLDEELGFLPADAASRESILSENLEKLNEIYPKLAPEIAYTLYKGLLGLAEETAKASGGFLRIGAVSAAEYELVKLPMIAPVENPDHEAGESDGDSES